MNPEKPTLSIIIATYNRGHLVERSIESLFRQTFQDFEIIVVDDGSKDNTLEVLSKYKDKIRLFRHPQNRGVCAAKNTGLDNIRGEWFTTLDDDDELIPEALETMIRLPGTKDPEIDAITCNCMDTQTGAFSGKGLSGDQYLPLADIVRKCSGEFWGITKTSLLGDKRFNEDLPGVGNVLWYQIDAIAKRYYIHKALRIYHTEGDDHVTTDLKSVKKKIAFYTGLQNENFYWEVLRDHHPTRFRRECVKGLLFSAMGEDKEGMLSYKKRIGESGNDLSTKLKVLSKLPDILGPSQLKTVFTFAKNILHPPTPLKGGSKQVVGPPLGGVGGEPEKFE